MLLKTQNMFIYTYTLDENFNSWLLMTFCKVLSSARRALPTVELYYR